MSILRDKYPTIHKVSCHYFYTKLFNTSRCETWISILESIRDRNRSIGYRLIVIHIIFWSRNIEICSRKISVEFYSRIWHISLRLPQKTLRELILSVLPDCFYECIKNFFIEQLNHGQKLSAHGRPPKNRIGPAHPMVFVSKIFGPWAGLGWAGLGRAGRGLAQPIRSSVPYIMQLI